MIEVNLLPLQNVLSQRENQLRQNLTLFASVLAALIVVCQVFFFLANTVVDVQNLAYQKTRDDLLISLKQNNYEAAVDLRTVNDKIAGIAQVKKNQKDFGKLTGDMLNLIQPNAQVTSFSFDTTGDVKVTAISQNLGAFGAFIDKLTAAKSVPLPFSQIIISGIREQDSTVNFALMMKYTFAD